MLSTGAAHAPGPCRPAGRTAPLPLHWDGRLAVLLGCGCCTAPRLDEVPGNKAKLSQVPASHPPGDPPACTTCHQPPSAPPLPPSYPCRSYPSSAAAVALPYMPFAPFLTHARPPAFPPRVNPHRHHPPPPPPSAPPPPPPAPPPPPPGGPSPFADPNAGPYADTALDGGGPGAEGTRHHTATQRLGCATAACFFGELAPDVTTHLTTIVGHCRAVPVLKRLFRCVQRWLSCCVLQSTSAVVRK